MTIFEEISIIANKIANQGKKPTVAIIKNKLSSPTPLPTIINALKNWQHDPEFTEIKSHKETTRQQENIEGKKEDIEALIEKALAPIKAELAEIKALLKQQK